jgi:hypothetical protein
MEGEIAFQRVPRYRDGRYLSSPKWVWNEELLLTQFMEGKIAFQRVPR